MTTTTEAQKTWVSNVPCGIKTPIGWLTYYDLKEMPIKELRELASVSRSELERCCVNFKKLNRKQLINFIQVGRY